MVLDLRQNGTIIAVFRRFGWYFCIVRNSLKLCFLSPQSMPWSKLQSWVLYYFIFNWLYKGEELFLSVKCQAYFQVFGFWRRTIIRCSQGCFPMFFAPENNSSLNQTETRYNVILSVQNFKVVWKPLWNTQSNKKSSNRHAVTAYR